LPLFFYSGNTIRPLLLSCLSFYLGYRTSPFPAEIFFHSVGFSRQICNNRSLPFGLSSLNKKRDLLKGVFTLCFSFSLTESTFLFSGSSFFFLL